LADQAYSLVSVVSPEHWVAYHDLRRKVLFQDRGLFCKYDSNHQDDRKPENHPVILTCNGAPVAAMRIDLVATASFAIMRTVAVTTNHQRRGYGRIMLSLAEEYALHNGYTAAVVFAAPDAVGFYTKCGYTPYMWDAHGTFGSGPQMRKLLTSGRSP
jgi:GNAT superfamily N-acetyltransferase